MLLAVRDVHLTVGVLVHTEQFLSNVLTKISQELLLDIHLLTGGSVFALLFCLFFSCGNFLEAGFGLKVLAGLLLIFCLGFSIGSILGLLKELDIGCESLV